MGQRFQPFSFFRCDVQGCLGSTSAHVVSSCILYACALNLLHLFMRQETSILRVISRQSVMQYKGSRKPVQEIARELNVDAVLEGTVVRSGDRVRVTVHLDRTSPEGQLWASSYDRNMRDILGLQAEIARSVTDEIEVKLTPQERARLASARPVNPEAHDDYLRGQFFLYRDKEEPITEERVTKRNLQTAIGYFRQAIEKDPDYAL